MPEQTPHQTPHIVIIGCGFGGLEAAKAFKGKAVRVSLIDRTNHHLFQPLLYQVATAGLAAPLISAPIRHLFRSQDNVTTLLGEVRSIDAMNKRLEFVQPSSGVPHALAFDHLIVAAGASHSYFGNDAWEAHAPGLKTLQDAFDIRRKILMAFEAAEAQDDTAQREALLTFVVIGAGPTGVEMAGTLAEIARHTLPGEFRRINPASAKVILVEGGARVLQAMPLDLSEKALKQLVKLGVDVRLNAKVTQIDAQGIQVDTLPTPTDLEAKTASSPQTVSARSYQIHSKTIIWAAGVAASALGKQLASSTGCELDRAGRVKVLPDLSLPQVPSISVIGDMASLMRDVDGKSVPVPGVSPAAKQMGRCAAANILRRIQGQSTLAFHYADYGNLATIGRNAAVVDLATPLGALRFSGKLAWLFWLFAHIYFLIGFRNRFVVLADWTNAYLSFSRNARVVAEAVSPESS
ncbi:NAD(P)/FAD-dependent oxidoreductase [Variovorax sp. PCZ-1]|uniref:NAD(P)/FAD-dependent oxidoreductase n=1 Tax=Variovorax sp. PCZ-1 TaxID=2835533 RepID=UPI001BCF1700|nr:NAD(P)/FAD-dependent oxidoreductase [Variovorax sp. PCZ-1]MBS7807927.1 NAD(P)/FAD-dependent oxidoreductase [Variovorax sp. PCZ-1]